MKKSVRSLILLAIFFLVSAGGALAQNLSFSLDSQTVDVFWNEDGSASIHYVFDFTNDRFASPIQYIDVGIPHPDFDLNSISADVDGQPASGISASDFQGEGGIGVAVDLGSNAIQPGETGTVRVVIDRVNGVLFDDDKDPNYASAVFRPVYFGSEYVHGNTDLTVSFHMPPGVKPEEPRWHNAPTGFPAEPEAYLDEQGRVTYTWQNTAARPDRPYQFGASFPRSYVPSTTVKSPTFTDRTGISTGSLISFTLCGGFILFIGLIIFASARSTENRKLQYLPPKISIEGHGIKRGLTAVEAAILLEEQMDKILTMILFGLIKKEVATVTTREPLEIKASQPLPENLQPYEIKFLEAFEKTGKAERRQGLQDMMIDLIQSVSQKMKGFSRRETVAYYRDIMNRAWAQVEAAGTPEVKSAKYDEVMEWTMLDRDYERRTRDVFRTGPVFVPTWWPRYDPTFGRGTSSAPSRPASAPSGGGGGVNLPHLPGSDFAASVVGGVESFSAGVIGNLTDFTGRITQKTNPIPVSTTTTRSFGGGGGGRSCACACACACAGCACACAGGGR